jgi:hypothetical protein
LPDRAATIAPPPRHGARFAEASRIAIAIAIDQLVQSPFDDDSIAIRSALRCRRRYQFRKVEFAV